MKKLITTIIACLLVGPALAQTGAPKTRSQLSTEINTNMPNNTSGRITPQIMRQTLQDMIYSSWLGNTTQNASSNQLSLSGNTLTAATVSGNLTSGNCINADGAGNLVSGSGACVSSGSGVAAGTAGQFGVYAGNGSIITGATPTGWFDTVWCNTAGYVIARLSGAWACSNAFPANVVWLGADPTGVTSLTATTAIFQSALNTYKVVYAPKGTYNICNLQFNADSQVLLGDGVGNTVFQCSTASQNIINLVGLINNNEVGRFSCSRTSSITPTLPGACIGNSNADTTQWGGAKIHDIQSNNDYNGFMLGMTNFAFGWNLDAENSYNDGFFFFGDATNPLQWNLTNVSVGKPNANCFEISLTNIQTPLELWNGVFTFNCGSRGIYAHSTGSGSIHGWHVDGFIIAGSADRGLDMQGECVQCWIGNGLLEGAGTSNVGRSNNIAAVASASGVYLSGNLGINFFNMSSATSNGGSGFESDGTNINVSVQNVEASPTPGGYGFYLHGGGGSSEHFMIGGGTRDGTNIKGINSNQPNVSVVNSYFQNGCTLIAGSVTAANFGTGC